MGRKELTEDEKTQRAEERKKQREEEEKAFNEFANKSLSSLVDMDTIKKFYHKNKENSDMILNLLIQGCNDGKIKFEAKMVKTFVLK